MRVARRVLVCLCLGVMLTWASAWGLASGLIESLGVDSRLTVDDERTPARLFRLERSFGVTRVDCLSDHPTSPREHLEQLSGGPLVDVPVFARHLQAFWSTETPTAPYALNRFGWPWRAMASETWMSPDQSSVPDHVNGFATEQRGALLVAYNPWRTLGLKVPSSMRLPLLPIWPGLIADILFYALLAWYLLFGFVTLRGWRRRRKGRCGWRGGCGYDLSGSVGTVCPECGRPVGGGAQETPAGPAADAG